MTETDVATDPADIAARRDALLARYATGFAEVADPSTARPTRTSIATARTAGRRAWSSITWPTANRWPTPGSAASSPRTSR